LNYSGTVPFYIVPGEHDEEERLGVYEKRLVSLRETHGFFTRKGAAVRAKKKL
jgi:hypothetical protein